MTLPTMREVVLLLDQRRVCAIFPDELSDGLSFLKRIAISIKPNKEFSS